MRTIAIVAAVVILPSIVLAQNGAIVAPPGRWIEPLVDDQTLIVVHVDLTRIDVDAVIKQIVKALPQDSPDRQVLPKAAEQAKEMIGAITKIGVQDFYVISGPTDMPGMPGFGLVIPLRAGGIAATVEHLPPGGELRTGSQEQAITAMALQYARGAQAKKMGNALVLGDEAQLKRFSAAATQPARRPELVSALEAAGEGAIQLAIIPNDDTRRVIEEMLPEIPKELGGGKSTVLTQGMLWLGASLELGPKISLRVVAQSKDAVSAKALAQWWPRFLRLALTFSVSHQDFGVTTQPTRQQASIIDMLVETFTPTLHKDRLVLLPDDKRIDSLLRAIWPLLERAREDARRAASLSQLDMLGRTIAVYAGQHNNQWPASLQALIKGKAIDPRMLKNPLRPDMEVGYIYIKPSLPQDKLPAAMVVAYEDYKTWGEGINVLFADSHVERIKDEARFKKLLAASKAVTQPTVK